VKLESDVCCRLQVAPSGESYEGNRRPGRKERQPTAGSLLRDSLHVTFGLTACTPGSAPGPTLGNEYGKTLPFFTQGHNIKPQVLTNFSPSSVEFFKSTNKLK